MGFREPVRRSTLAYANETRDWRIYAELAERLIVQARKLYANEDLGLDLSNAVYALDSTTIDLCLSFFPWAYFRTTKAAVKMHIRLAERLITHPVLGQYQRRTCGTLRADGNLPLLVHGIKPRRDTSDQPVLKAGGGAPPLRGPQPRVCAPRGIGLRDDRTVNRTPDPPM
jgi:hypothetical protein